MGATMAVASAGVTLVGAMQQRAAYRMQARQFEEQKEMAGLQMGADVISRENNLFSILASLDASSASRGVVGGPSGNTGLRSGENKYAAQDIRNIKIMGYSNMRNFGLSAASAKMSGRAAVTSALGSAGSAIGGASLKTPGPTQGTLTGFKTQLQREWS